MNLEQTIKNSDENNLFVIKFNNGNYFFKSSMPTSSLQHAKLFTLEELQYYMQKDFIGWDWLQILPVQYNEQKISIEINTLLIYSHPRQILIKMIESVLNTYVKNKELLRN